MREDAARWILAGSAYSVPGSAGRWDDLHAVYLDTYSGAPRVALRLRIGSADWLPDPVAFFVPQSIL